MHRNTQNKYMLSTLMERDSEAGIELKGLAPGLPKPCPRVDCLPSLGSAREKAIIWDMHVFINQLIECEISFKRNFYMDWNFEYYDFLKLDAFYEEFMFFSNFLL